MREVATGLLVLVLAGQEDRNLDPLHPVARGPLVEQQRGPVRIGLDQVEHIERLETQLLVLEALRIALVVDHLARPALPAFRRRLGVADPVADPGEGEARVEDAARVAGAVVDVGRDRHRRDRGEVRRTGTGHEQLADAGIGDPGQAHLALRPVLRRHRLDRVVAVIGGRQAEQVVGTGQSSRSRASAC